jgi:hypothetical protein
MHAALNLYPRILKDGINQPNRAMLIFLDDSEIDLGVVNYAALAALYQKTCPMLISASLVKNIFKERLDDSSYKEQMNAKDELLKQREKSSSFDKYVEIKQDLLYETVRRSFDPSEWTICQVNDALYLLVPNIYIKQSGDISTIPPTEEFTRFELSLGLKIDHLSHLTFEQLKKLIQGMSTLPKNAADTYFIKALYENGKSQLFILSSEYNNKNLIPQWALYIVGHGSLARSIANLSIAKFKYFLDFLDKKILTKILVYESCYSYGINTQSIATNKGYTFPMLIQNLTKSEVWVIAIIKPAKSPSLYPLEFTVDFTQFMSDALSDEPIPYSKLWKAIFSDPSILSPESSPGIPSTNNFPFVYLPIRNAFLSLLKTIVIDSIMAASRTQSLDIQSYASSLKTEGGLTYILISVPTVPFPLIIRKLNNKPPVITIIPPDISSVTFDTIKSDFSLQTLLSDAFFNSEKRPKKYFIKTLNFTGPDVKGMYYTDVVILYEDGQNVAYAQQPNGTSVVIDRSEPKEMNAYQRNKYTNEKKQILTFKELRQALQDNNSNALNKIFNTPLDVTPEDIAAASNSFLKEFLRLYRQKQLALKKMQEIRDTPGYNPRDPYKIKITINIGGEKQQVTMAYLEKELNHIKEDFEEFLKKIGKKPPSNDIYHRSTSIEAMLNMRQALAEDNLPKLKKTLALSNVRITDVLIAQAGKQTAPFLKLQKQIQDLEQAIQTIKSTPGYNRDPYEVTTPHPATGKQVDIDDLEKEIATLKQEAEKLQ